MRLKFFTKGKFKEMYIAGPQLSLGYYGEKKLNFDNLNLSMEKDISKPAIL